MRYVGRLSSDQPASNQKANLLQFELLDPKRYQVENSWFFRQYGLDVRVRKRLEEESHVEKDS